MQTSQRRAWKLVVSLAALLLLVGCSQHDTGTDTTTTTEASESSADSGRCATVEAPLQDIPAMNDREPTLRIPVPDGWKPDDLASQTIRYTIVATDASVANAVVTLESLPSPQPSAAVFERVRVNLEIGGASDLEVESNSTCGFPSETLHYMAPPALQTPPVLSAPDRPTLMHTVVVEGGGSQYLVTLTIQTADPDSSNYVSDAQEIVDGFQIQLSG